MDDIFKIAGAVIASLGGGALIVAAFSHWLGGIWAKRMLQNERAKHSEKLEELKQELDTLKAKDLTRHHDKLVIYRDVVHIVSEILRELEAVSLGKKEKFDQAVEQNFSLNRNKAYGYIALVSSQEVMDRYNEMIDFFIEIMYEGAPGTWHQMREKADQMLNAMREDLGIEDTVNYRGRR